MSVTDHALRLRSRLLQHKRAWQRRITPTLPPNADAITPGLIVGGFIDEEDWRQLYDQGVRVVVSLQGERHDEAVFGDRQPVGYVRLPTTDFNPPLLGQLRMGAAFIDQAIQSGETVLVHCHAGVGRSTMQCAAYLIMHGMTLEEAWALIKSKRIHAVWNERQQLAMKIFAAEIAGERRPHDHSVNDHGAEPAA